tara:strand:+ start:748 stop:1560 length:813 start_codon:yes stop_codon:yes gene_type:complete
MTGSGNERVVIKLGGSLITEKSKLCTPRREVIKEIALAINELRSNGISMILVHGAGSFGHLKAKSWSLDKGTNESISGGFGLTSQIDAVNSVRADMEHLNSIIVDELSNLDIPTMVHPPRDWVTGIGHNFTGDLSRFASYDFVHITFGDVVDCNDERLFGILSGDDLIYRIGTEMENVSRIIFAMGDVDGLMTEPPESENSKLIQTWSSKDGINGLHDENVDVTGGIFLKASRAAKAAECGLDVLFIRGTKNRIISASMGKDCISTRIIS